ncbi:MAG: dephospho-CoA kinase [Octadecabacter sp.]|nr:dephospho-CoA kinase [Octadecabacter sp.]
MTYVLGLTGSIGMGKSTTAAMFAEAGVPVWDADAVVRRLYAKGGAATALIADRFPEAIENGAVSRDKLRKFIEDDPTILDWVQSVVHPLVAKDRTAFLSGTPAPVVLLDVPLLFEGGADALCDGVAVVTVDAATQRARVLDRGEMTPEQFEMILRRQMPDAEKRARATWVIVTDTLENARKAVQNILTEIERITANA